MPATRAMGWHLNVRRGMLSPLVLGVVTRRHWRHPMVGLPGDHAVSRFEESYAIMRRLFAGERFAFRGEHYALAETWLSTMPEQPVR